MSEAVRQVVVLGAGVIGQVYAGRLAESGIEVWLVARGATRERLRAEGLHLWRGDELSAPPVHLVASPTEVPPVDAAISPCAGTRWTARWTFSLPSARRLS